jgi:hypothetical protein
MKAEKNWQGYQALVVKSLLTLKACLYVNELCKKMPNFHRKILP